MTSKYFLLTIDEAAAATALEIAIVRHCADVGLVAPAAGYGEPDLAELRRVRRLIDDLELGMPAVEVVLRMRRQMLALQSEVRRLEVELRRAGRAPASQPPDDADWDDWM